MWASASSHGRIMEIIIISLLEPQSAFHTSGEYQTDTSS